MTCAHRTHRAAVAELRTAVGGGVRYALLGSAVVVALVAVKLGVLAQDSLARSERELEAPALERLPAIVEAPRALSLRHAGGRVLVPSHVASARDRGKR